MLSGSIFKKFIENVKRPTAAGVIAALFIQYLILFLAYQLYIADARRLELGLVNYLGDVKHRVEQVVDRNTTSLASLSLAISPDGGVANFESVAKDVIASNPNVKTLAILPDGVYKHLYPLTAGNKTIIGFDFLKNADQFSRSRAQEAIEKRQVRVVGPFPNVDNDSVIILMYPVFIKNEFWGLTMMTTALGSFINNIDSDIPKSLNVYISNTDPRTNKDYIFYSRDKDSSKNRQRINRVEGFTNNHWKIYGSIPRRRLLSVFVFPFILSTIVALIVGAYVNSMINAPKQLRRKVEEAQKTLESTDLRFKSIYDNAPIGIAQLDVSSSKLVGVNEKFCELIGAGKDDILNRRLWDFVPGSLYRKLYNEFQKMSRGEKQKIEQYYKHTRADGSEVWVHAILKPVIDARGIIDGYILEAEDLTEVYNAKSAAEASEEQFKSMFYNSPIAIAEYDYSQVREYLVSKELMNKSITDISEYFSNNIEEFAICTDKLKVRTINNKALSLFNYPDRSATKKSLSVIANMPEVWETTFQFFKAVSNGVTSFEFDGTIVTQPEELKSVNFFWNVMPGFEQDLSRVLISMIDVTQVKKNEAAILLAQNRALDSEKHFRSLFQESPVALWEEDFSGLQKYFTEHKLMNKTFDELVNYFVGDRDAFRECFDLFRILAVNNKGVSLFDARDRTHLLENVKFLISRPESVHYIILALTALSNNTLSASYQTSVFTLSGKIKYIHYQWSVMPGHEHDFSRIIVAMMDITQQKEAEMKALAVAEQLQNSQERFRSLFEESPIALWEEDFSAVRAYLKKNSLMGKTRAQLEEFFSANPEILEECFSLFKVVAINKASLTLYETETKEALYTAFRGIIRDPAPRRNIISQIYAVSNNLRQYQIESYTTTPLGKEKNISLNWSVLPGYEESFGRVIIAITDVTDIKQSEREIEAARARLETIINTVNGIVWTIDPDTNRYTFVSENSEQLTKYSREEWTDRLEFCTRYIHREDAVEVLEQWRHFKQEIKPYSLEFRLMGKDGTEKWFRESVNFITKDCRLLSVIGIMVDVDDYKRARNHLQRSLNIVSEQNKQLMQFSYIVSHNLRSHAGNMQALSALLVDEDATPDERNEYAGHIHNITKMLNDTLEGLNEVTQIQTTVDLSLKTLNLRRFIENTLEILSNVINAKHALIVTDVSPEVTVAYYQPYLESVLLCFISNALKYSSPDRMPLIKIIYEEKNGDKILSIADNGIGIDMKQHGEKLFGLFKKFTSHPDSRGIGLYIAKHQIEVMGGSVTVESQPDVGTTFRIFFNKKFS